MDTVQTPSDMRARAGSLGSPAVFMQWHNLLFAHWPLRAEKLRPMVPRELEIDTWDGWAWIGVVPFYLHIRYWWMPRSMAFPEVNVRTYVKHGERSGVWFLSLDAHSRLAVIAARNRFGLPYHLARMQMQIGDQPTHPAIEFSSRRKKAAPKNSAQLQAKYWPTGEAYQAEPGTLDYFLTERYRLFTADGYGRIGRGEIDHAPWQLQAAAAEFAVHTLFAPLGLPAPAEKPELHFSAFVEAVVWKVRWS